MSGAKIKGLTWRDGVKGRVYKYKRDFTRPGFPVETIYATLGSDEEEAQREAIRLNDLIKRGIHPTKGTEATASLMTVRQLMEHYRDDLKARGKSQRAIDDIMPRAERYLKTWLDRPFTSINRALCRELHKDLTEKHGKRTANIALANFSAAWNVAVATLDGEPPPNPTKAVRKHKQGRADYSGFSLAAFWKDVDGMENPIRRAMFTLGVLTGLRPGNLRTLRWSWVKDDRIIIPRAEMKVKEDRPDFFIPLTAPMKEALALANATCDLLYKGSPWVFPTHSAKDQRTVTATVVVRPYGHKLRHVYRTTAASVGIHPEQANVLVDHSQIGTSDLYISRADLSFNSLSEAQEKITAALLQTKPS